jgi:hypothetical protein
MFSLVLVCSHWFSYALIDKIHIKTSHVHVIYIKMNVFKKFIPFSKTKPDNLSQPTQITSNPISNHENMCSDNENTCDENIIIENDVDFYLPTNPVPFRKITIVNIEKKSIIVHSSNHCKLYHYFFCPTGSTQIILQKYNSFCMFYVETSENAGTWICK